MKFDRQAKVIIRIRNPDFSYEANPIEINNLRVSFTINKTIAYTTNTGIIKIWNLSQEKRNRLINFGDQVILYAGYRLQDNSQIIFIGDTYSVSHVYDQPDIITVLECGDGERFLNQIRVTLSFGENTPATLVLKEIASQMGIEYTQTAITDNLVYRWGYKDCVSAREALATVCGKLNLQSSVQNNRLQVLPLNATQTEPPFEINENTGMQGIPQRFTYRNLDLFRPHPSELRSPLSPRTGIASPNTGFKVNMILFPQIIPGKSSILLTSQHLNLTKGSYSVKSVRHEGDTYGFLWSTQLEVVELPSNVT